MKEKPLRCNAGRSELFSPLLVVSKAPFAGEFAMARTPKPWYWKNRKSWFVTIDGERHNLGPDRAAAKDQYHALMLRPAVKRLPAQSVHQIVDQFLAWTHTHRATRTYDWYIERTSSFCKTLPATLTVPQLKPFHLQAWLDDHPKWSDGMKTQRSPPKRPSRSGTGHRRRLPVRLREPLS